MLRKESFVIGDREFAGYRLMGSRHMTTPGSKRRLQAYFVEEGGEGEPHVLVVDEVVASRTTGPTEYTSELLRGGPGPPANLESGGCGPST